jgi:hypothetical protein
MFYGIFLGNHPFYRFFLNICALEPFKRRYRFERFLSQNQTLPRHHFVWTEDKHCVSDISFYMAWQSSILSMSTEEFVCASLQRWQQLLL